ncbi:DsrE family protein [Flagellimonas sp. DF-77]|uniref:DsrE family protein n=1 Tax=Flagellimonas algarum TaxID=3230298 RepID=UPI003390E6D0
MKNHIPLVFLLLTLVLQGQTKRSGPVIADYGKVWEVKDIDYRIAPDTELRVVFDIMASPENTNVRNSSIETAARFLNMHVQSGIPKSQLKVALVVHNKASKDIITDAAYEKRFGHGNPNAEMVAQLLAADVDIIFCGQSSLSRGYPKDELIPGVQLALSAMTALISLQNEGYRFIKF